MLGAVLVTVVLTACAPRYEEQRIDWPRCPSPANPPLRIDSASAASPGELRGLVLHVDERGPSREQVETGLPVEGALVYLKAQPSTHGLTDSNGRVTFHGLSPGVHVLVTRLIGHQMREDTLRLASDTGVAVVIPLLAVPTDSCGWEVVVRKRKPWWKLW